MAFASLKLEELLKAAETFRLEGLSEKPTKNEILVGLNERGISWANYKKFVENEEKTLAEPQTQDKIDLAEEDESASAKFSSQVLLKMERRNRRYDILGYTFTDTNPFKVMTPEEAQQIIDSAQGFRIASPKEAKSFYS